MALVVTALLALALFAGCVAALAAMYLIGGQAIDALLPGAIAAASVYAAIAGLRWAEKFSGRAQVQ